MWRGGLRGVCGRTSLAPGPARPARGRRNAAPALGATRPRAGPAGRRYNQNMVTAGRRKAIAFFIALGIGLISVILLLYVGWVLLNWEHAILLVCCILLLLMVISGVVLNATFL